MRAIFLTILLAITGPWLLAQSDDNTVQKAELEFSGVETLASSSFNVSITYHFTQPISTGITLKVLDFGTPVANSVFFTKDSKSDTQQINFTGNAIIMTGEIDSLTALSLKDKLIVFYRVPLPDLNDSFDFNIPIVYPDIPSASNNAGLFTASLELPSTVNLYEQFPAQTWSVEDRKAIKMHELSLQAVPSVIKLQGGTGPQPMFSTLRLIDGLIILLLIILLFLGWKKIKQV